MSGDTETFRRRKRALGGDDFPSMATDMMRGIHWKVVIFLYLSMIFIFSDSYIEMVLAHINGAVDGDTPTMKGTLIQISSAILAYIIIDLMTQAKFL